MSASESHESADEEIFVDDDAIIESDAAGESSPDDAWTQEVLQQLDQLQNGRRSTGQSLLILVVTLLLFGAAGLVQNNPENLAWLVLVLVIHEAGHFAGMKLFGYRDVKMFFLPFFGAAVSGRSLNVPGWQAAIVLLLGPLPGITIGIVLGILALVFDKESLRSTALLFASLNGFNLLPFLPLDGGRLLQLLLFGRQRHLEALFQALTGILMALVAFYLGAWILGVVGILMLIGSGHTFRISTIARRAREELGDQATVVEDVDRIPTETARHIIRGIRSDLPQAKKPKVVATFVRQVWDRMHTNSPGAAATLALLALYAVSFISMLVMCGVLALAGAKQAAAGP